MEQTLYYKKATSNDYTTLLAIWERSVSSTHNFLSSDDFGRIKNNIPNWLSNLDVQIWYNDSVILGFTAINNSHLEMLFLDVDYLGFGYGTKILKILISTFRISTVDVNEDNHQAYNFYRRNGFTIISRSEKDGMGMPYPLLHLKLK